MVSWETAPTSWTSLTTVTTAQPAGPALATVWTLVTALNPSHTPTPGPSLGWRDWRPWAPWDLPAPSPASSTSTPSTPSQSGPARTPSPPPGGESRCPPGRDLTSCQTGVEGVVTSKISNRENQELVRCLESSVQPLPLLFIFLSLQLRSLAGARSGSVSLVDCNSFTDSPARESSFIETRNRNNRRSPAMPGRIVGALNQGIASLGEKIGKNTATTTFLYYTK